MALLVDQAEETREVLVLDFTPNVHDLVIASFRKSQLDQVAQTESAWKSYLEGVTDGEALVALSPLALQLVNTKARA